MELHEPSPEASAYTYKKALIESVSDVLNLIQKPREFFGEIMDAESPGYDVAPLGRTDVGFPRPYPFGIWFRGQGNASWDVNPDIFRRIGDKKAVFDYYEEKHMFHDLRLRSDDFPLEGNTNFDLIALMKHHGLPTRLLDWSENILVALFFAVANNYEKYFKERPSSNDLVPVDGRDASLYVINAYRLNEISSLIESPGIMNPSNLDISLRTAQAEHIYLEDAINTGCIEGESDLSYQEAILSKDLLQYIKDIRPDRKSKLLMPVALIPKRKHPRMIAQLSTFTVHGGKHIYSDRAKEIDDYHFIKEPKTLHALNMEEIKKKHEGLPFMLKFNISKFAIKRIMVELDRMGITEPVIYPDMEKQIAFMKRRWGVGISERAILNLPLLKKSFGIRTSANLANYKELLYGGGSAEDGKNS